MKKINSILLFFAVMIAFTSCKKATDILGLSQAEKDLVAVQPWKSAGLFANGTPVPGTNALKYEIAFTSTGVPGLPGSIKVNNTVMPALWTVSGSSFTFTYPSGYTSSTGLSAGNFTGTVNISANQLDFIAPATGEANLFGLISIPANNTLRFTPDGSSIAAGSASSTLIGNYTAQLFTVGPGGGAGTATGSTYSMKFQTFLGINAVLIGSVPAPTTWSLAADNTNLTFNYPSSTALSQTAGTAQFIVVGTIPSTAGGKFRIKNLSATASITLYGVLTIGVGQELELTRQ